MKAPNQEVVDQTNVKRRLRLMLKFVTEFWPCRSKTSRFFMRLYNIRGQMWQSGKHEKRSACSPRRTRGETRLTSEAFNKALTQQFSIIQKITGSSAMPMSLVGSEYSISLEWNRKLQVWKFLEQCRCTFCQYLSPNLHHRAGPYLPKTISSSAFAKYSAIHLCCP